MKQDQVMALVKAHNERDEERFRRTALQIASHAKSPFKEELQRAAQRTLAALPVQVQGFLAPMPTVEIESLVLDEKTVALLREIAEEMRFQGLLSLRGIPARSRLLFCGPPGNGKTATAAAFAGLLNLTPFVANLGAIVESHMGDTARNMVKAFAALHAGQLLVLDEVDSVGSERASGNGADKERAHTVNVILTEMDRSIAGILVATTNRRDMLDPALLRRFDEIVEFPAPQATALTQLQQKIERRFGLRYDQEARWQEGTSFDAVTKWVMKRARREAVAEMRLNPSAAEVA